MRDKSSCHWIGAGIASAIAGGFFWFFINQLWTIDREGVLERQGWPLSSVYMWVTVGAGLGVAIEVTRYRRERRRSGRLEELSQELGFRFTPQVDPEDLADWSAFPVFEKWSAARNHLAGQFAGVPVEMVDYTYVEAGGENSTSYDQTLALLCGSDDMPAFELRPRTFGIRMLSAMGAEGIEFSAQTTSPVDQQIVQEFHKNYYLSSRSDAEPKTVVSEYTTSHEHQEAVRRWFSLDTLAFFAKHPGWHIQSAGGRLALWRPKKIIAPARRSAFLEQALSVRDALITTRAARSRDTLAAATSPPQSIEARFTAAGIGGLVGFFSGGISGGIIAGLIFFGGERPGDDFFIRFLLGAGVFFGGAFGGLFLGMLVGRRAFTGLVRWFTARRAARVANHDDRMEGQPITSNAVVAQAAVETTITLPAVGLVRGCGCFLFVWALFWNLFLVIATPLFLISAFRGEMEMEGSNEPMHPAMMILFLTPFWIVGLTALWFIVSRGRQWARVTVSPERLTIEEVRLLGTRPHNWRRDELTAVRLVEDPLNRSRLSIECAGRPSVEVLKYRDTDELAWVARVVDDELIRSGGKVPPAASSPAAADRNR